jgi:CRISP-associated protein Cas1
MSEIQQNTLYLLTPCSYIARDHLTLQVEVPVYPPDLPPEKRTREAATDWRKLSIPIHHLESICVFGPSTVSPPALDLCWEHGVAVNYLSEYGHFQARLTGGADTSVQQVIDALARQLKYLADQGDLEKIRGAEGMASQLYFSVFTLTLKQQRDAFRFVTRTRRPPRDRINCLLSFTYAGDRQPVRQPRSEFLHQVQRQGRTVWTVRVEKAHERVPMLTSAATQSCRIRVPRSPGLRKRNA